MFHIYPAFTTIFHAHSLDKQFVIYRCAVRAVESRERHVPACVPTAGAGGGGGLCGGQPPARAQGRHS